MKGGGGGGGRGFISSCLLTLDVNKNLPFALLTTLTMVSSSTSWAVMNRRRRQRPISQTESIDVDSNDLDWSNRSQSKAIESFADWIESGAGWKRRQFERLVANWIQFGPRRPRRLTEPRKPTIKNELQ